MDTLDHVKPIKAKKPFGILGKENKLKWRREDDDTLDILSENLFIESSSFANLDVVFKHPSDGNTNMIKPQYGSHKKL